MNKVRNPTYSEHICYQHVILPNLHVLTITVSAMDQKLNFCPPGGQFYTDLSRILEEHVILPTSKQAVQSKQCRSIFPYAA